MVSRKELAQYIDHTILGPDVTTEKVIEETEYAKEIGAASVCVSPDRLDLVVPLLAESDVKACTVIGFPHGTSTTDTKVFEVKNAYEQGAVELDVVMNIGHLKDNNEAYILNEFNSIVKATPGTIKIILETNLLTTDEIIQASQLAERAGANFVKTSTGYAESGAKIADVRLMKETVSNEMQVKAAGGIRTLEAALDMVEAGATRIGASRTKEILAEIDE